MPAAPKEEPKTSVIMKTSLAGPRTAVHVGDPYECGEAEAKRLVDAGYAKRPPVATDAAA